MLCKKIRKLLRDRQNNSKNISDRCDLEDQWALLCHAPTVSKAREETAVDSQTST